MKTSELYHIKNTALAFHKTFLFLNSLILKIKLKTVSK